MEKDDNLDWKYYKKPKSSPNRTLKAHVCFKHDGGVYLKISSKTELIQKIKFLPTDYYAKIKALGEINWINENEIIIYFIMVGKDKSHPSNFKYYWIFNTNGSVEYKVNDIYITEKNMAHLYFELGKRLFEGKMILKNEQQGYII